MARQYTYVTYFFSVLHTSTPKKVKSPQFRKSLPIYTTLLVLALILKKQR